MPASPLLSIPQDIVCAADYERYARNYIEEASWAYLQGGAADELTIESNRTAWDAMTLWPRVLNDLRGGHTRCKIFGDTLAHPIILAPVATQCLFHPQGEVASVLAASVMGGAAVVSTQASISLENIASDVAEHLRAEANQTATPAGGLLWFQLYWQGGRDATLALLKRAETAGYRVLVLTVDAPISGARNREQRAGFSVPVQAAQSNILPAIFPPLTENMSTVFDGFMAIAPTWDDIAWLIKQTQLPMLLKGVMHTEDASKAMHIGAAGIVVSNHGGRVLDTTPATASVLKDVVQLVKGEVPILVDGGIRRGTDIVKAHALGASAVMIGRPYIHALATAGALGVAHLIRILREELEITMALTGCKTLEEIDKKVLCL